MIYSGPVEPWGPTTSADESHPSDRLFRHYKPRPVGRNLYLLADGTATDRQPWDIPVVKVLRGGIPETVTAQEAAAITAAGYGGYLS